MGDVGKLDGARERGVYLGHRRREPMSGGGRGREEAKPCFSEKATVCSHRLWRERRMTKEYVKAKRPGKVLLASSPLHTTTYSLAFRAWMNDPLNLWNHRFCIEILCIETIGKNKLHEGKKYQQRCFWLRHLSILYVLISFLGMDEWSFEPLES